MVETQNAFQITRDLRDFFFFETMCSNYSYNRRFCSICVSQRFIIIFFNSGRTCRISKTLGRTFSFNAEELVMKFKNRKII